LMTAGLYVQNQFLGKHITSSWIVGSAYANQLNNNTSFF